MSLFIEDGYTRRKDIDEAAGVHPAAAVVFRPALALKRAELGVIASHGNAEKIVAWENELIAKYVVSLDGVAVTKGDAAKLIPTLRNKILNLILGYDPSDEAKDAGN